VPTILLWLFVINLGIAFGAGLTNTVSSCRGGSAHRVPLASSGMLLLRVRTNRAKVLGFRHHWPLTLLTLANVVVAWRSTGAIP